MRRAWHLGRTWMARTALLALAWLLLAEAIEPQWTLALASWLVPGPVPIEVPGPSGTTLRLYADTRPHIGKVAGLQKGLVWTVGGRELVEEGYGLGCPIVQSEGRSYISRHATTEVLSTGQTIRLVKRFTIDTLDTPSRALRRKYRPVPARGTVQVEYRIQPTGVIDIEADLSRLEETWERVFLMNEQGARALPIYRDATGRRYMPEELSIWEASSHEQGCFESRDGSYAFCVQTGAADETYVGRERYLQYNWRGAYLLSWAGIDLVIDAPRGQFQYRVVLQAP